MRKRELEAKLAAQSEEFTEALRAQEVNASLREATWKAEHLKALQDAGWSSLGTATTRNRTWDDVRQNLEDAYSAWCVNPFAKSYVDYIKYFVIGRGTTVSAPEEDQEGQKRIDMFLEANDWELLEKDITGESSRDGEVFVQFHEKNRLGLKSEVSLVSLIDPLEIISITKDDKGEPLSYTRRWTKPNTSSPEDEEIPASEIYHIKLNASHNEDRGRSDLLPALPWLMIHKSWLKDMARRNYYAGAINWDVEVSGAISPDSVAAQYSTGPMPGSVIAHTPNEKWTVNSPDMKYADASEGARTMKLMICALFKMPESWFGDTGESNLATTKALSMPTLKMFTDRQDTLEMHFTRIVSRGAGVEDVTVEFPELVIEEANVKAAAMFSLSQAIANLIADDIISKETANKLLRSFDEDLPEWEEERKKVEEEDAKSVAAIAAGQSKAGPPGPRLQEEGAPPVSAVPQGVPPAS